jgi:hypothetical protein
MHFTSKVRLRASGEESSGVAQQENCAKNIFFIFLMDDDVKNAGFWDRSL